MASLFRTEIPAARIRETLRPHLLVDGFDEVLDLGRSQGSWYFEATNPSPEPRDHYVDFYTGFASMPLGYNHPRLQADDVLKRLGRIAGNKPACSDTYTAEQAAFVETLFRVAAPPQFPWAFLVEGGSVGIENALKTAFDWKVQKNLQRGFTPGAGYPDGHGHLVIHFKDCFHGRTGYTLSLTDSPDPAKTQWFPKFSWPRVTNPKLTFPLTEESLAETMKLEARALAEIHCVLRERPHQTAAMIIEPIQAEGGDNHFRPEFLQALRDLADEHEFLLIFDEVQTGVGITGSMWAHQTLGVIPDLLCFGKKMQVCGFLARRDRLDQVDQHVFKRSSRINSTWGGNLVDMVRSQLHLEIIEDEGLIERNVVPMGAHLLGALHQLQDDLGGAISNARGRGLLCAFDLHPSIDPNVLLREARRERVLVLKCGLRSIRFRPALNITADVIDEGMTRLRRALARLYDPSRLGS